MTRRTFSPEEETNWHENNDFQRYKRSCSVCGTKEYHLMTAPQKLNITVYKWNLDCYNCKKETPVIYLSDGFTEDFTLSVGYNHFKDLTKRLSEKYTFFKKTDKKLQETVSFGNVCVHCGRYQGDFFVFEDYIEFAGCSEGAPKDLTIQFELSEEETIEHARPEKIERLTNRTINKGTGEKILVCNRCWKEIKKPIIK